MTARETQPRDRNGALLFIGNRVRTHLGNVATVQAYGPLDNGLYSLVLYVGDTMVERPSHLVEKLND